MMTVREIPEPLSKSQRKRGLQTPQALESDVPDR